MSLSNYHSNININLSYISNMITYVHNNAYYSCAYYRYSYSYHHWYIIMPPRRDSSTREPLARGRAS